MTDHTPKPCGCKCIHHHTPIGVSCIERCPLHDAAPKLYAVLRACPDLDVTVVPDYDAVVNGPEHYRDWLRKVWVPWTNRAAAALALAEGKEAKA